MQKQYKQCARFVLSLHSYPCLPPARAPSQSTNFGNVSCAKETRTEATVSMGRKSDNWSETIPTGTNG